MGDEEPGTRIEGKMSYVAQFSPLFMFLTLLDQTLQFAGPVRQARLSDASNTSHLSLDTSNRFQDPDMSNATPGHRVAVLRVHLSSS